MTALNFPDSPSNGDTYQGYTYNSTKTAWAKPDTPDPDARTAVYANIAALPTSGTAGDMAYVTATNRLYLWNGSGWYNIALINTTPSISGVSATYNLAIDGTATTVTITASDPEGLPITYSIVSDTSGNTATVTQGTGASTNVFTITPSTNTAHAGTFSLTFRASDGVNIASSAASFTLVFSVQNQKYTTALFTSVGANNATNASFDDKSTSNHTILAGGEAHQTTFSPYRHGGHSVYLDGDDAIGVGVGSYALDWSNGQTWTVEFWMKRQGRNPDGHLFMKYPGSGSNISGIRAYVSGSEGRIGLHYNSGTELTTAGTRADIADGDWHHVAVTRGSGYFKIWVDGQLDATVSNSDADGMASSSSWAIGRHGSGTASSYLKDTLLRDFRIVGSEVYTSNFTAPTETLTAISGTQVLIANNLPYLKDSSSNATPLTYYGDPSIEGAGPFDKLEYTAATHLGSAHFDSSGDYLMAPSGTISSQNNSADFNFSSGAWTWEAWIYPSSLTSPASPHVFTSRYNGTYRSSFYYNSSASQLTYWSNGSARISGPALNQNQWYHVALSSDGTTTTMWVNGESKGTTTHMQSNYDQTMYVGAAAGASLETAGYWNGNITDARVVKGTQVYTSNFTPPAAPLTAVTNTKLLIQNTDGGIIDRSQGQRRIKLIGDVKSSTTQNKFLSSSIKFDDNGDYILLKPGQTFCFGTKDFTVEYWIYYNAIGNYDYVYDGRNSSQTTGSWSVAHGYGGGNATILQWASGGGAVLTAASNPSTNQWVHVAFCRSGSTLKLFYDGTENQSVTDTTNYSTNLTHSYFGCRHSVEHYLNAYLSDFRVTNGLARYTANFTAPTAALKG
tara:strand:+ start:929 stop:3469 length:2541 start_codon:yes stop_codon:yes gene_type:complete